MKEKLVTTPNQTLVEFVGDVVGEKKQTGQA